MRGCMLVVVAGALLSGTARAEDVVSASFYSRNGLVLHYDGIENAGAGVHADAPAKWVNLAGAADGTYDVALPSWVTSDANSMYSGVIPNLSDGAAINASKSSAPILSAVEGVSAATPVTTVEVVMARDAAWTYTDNYYNTQHVFTYPHGGICLRSSGAPANPDYCVVYPISATQTDMTYWQPAGVKSTEPHTLAATLGAGVHTRWLDGAKDGGAWNPNYSSAMGTTFRFFTNSRVGIRVYAIRLYNRALTADELAHHAKLDAIRFFGAAADDSLKMAVKDVPVQRFDGAEDAVPDPEVWDLQANRRLVRGVDYWVSYGANDRPGTGRLVVSGLGDYASVPGVRRTFAIDSAFTATLAAAPSGRLSADVSFPAAGTARRLFAAWGETDGGMLTNGWPAANVAQVADVPAGAATVTVTLPDAAASAPAIRFFLEHAATPRAYVTDGLRALYDGVYNAGTYAEPVHDAAATNWLDLTGNGNSVWMPDYVAVQEDAVVSQVRTDPATGQKTSNKTGTYPFPASLNGLATAPESLTLETATKCAAAWTFSDNLGNLQFIANTPLGGVGYRESGNTAYGIGYLAQNGGKNVATYNSWWHATADRRQVHTLTARLMPGASNNTFLMDGVADPKAQSSNFWQDTAALAAVYRFFANSRADVTAHSVRLYARRLSDLEVKRNAAVDRARFRGGNGMILAASPLLTGGRFAAGNARHGRVDVSFAAAPRARRLYAAWGDADCGAETNAWPNVAFLAAVPAGETRLTSVPLPQGAARAHVGRLFLVDVYDSTSYVAEGLAAHYDGIDNVVQDGVRGHDAAARTWSDLTGGGADVPLPDYVSVKSTCLLSVNHVGSSTVLVAVPGISSNSAAITLESVAACTWKVMGDFGNLQTPCATPLGAVGYRNNADNGFYYYVPASQNQLSLYDWYPAGADRTRVHTLATTLTYQGSERYLDAALSEKGDEGFYYPTRGDMCSFFGAPRADLNIYGVRIYSRLLSKEELEWNSFVDDVRFRGKAVPVRASDVVDFVGKGVVVIIR